MRGYAAAELPASAPIQIRLLGHTEAACDGRPLALGGAKQRAMLAMLGLRANATVSSDELIEGLWGEDAPASGVNMVQLYVSQLRRRLAVGRRVMRAATAVPLTNRRAIVLVSDRAGNVQQHIQLGPLLDEVWVR
jgi:DNA-binding SARP family transcriptional activator